RPARGAPLGAAALIAGVVFCGAAQAQGAPSQELLNELRTRLTEAPKCGAECANAAEAQVAANGDAISVALEMHAAERVAVPLPVDAAGTTVKSIQVDGVADDALARHEDGSLWIALNRGVHRVQVELVAHGDKVSLAFPFKPARVLFQGKGWEDSGLSD